MPEFTQWIDIDVEDFYEEMNKREKQEMWELLKEDFDYEDQNPPASPAAEIFQESLDKIKANMLMLSLDQEEFLINLAKSL